MRYVLILLLFSCYGKIDIHKKSDVDMFQLNSKPFCSEIDVIITENYSIIIGYSKNNFNMELDSTYLSTLDGLTYMVDDKVIIWLRKADFTPYSISVSNHELFHATSFIMNNIGIKLEDTTEEIYAYQLDYLTLQFYEHLDNRQ